MAIADYIQGLGHVRPYAPEYLPEQYPDLTGKVYIVTGGPTGVGFQVSRLLASKNAKVYLAARNQSKIDEAIEKISTEFPKADLDFLIVDLSDLPTIKPGVQKFLDQETRLDGLILNAGVMIPPAGSKTKQDYELQLGTNAVGHWAVAKLLENVLIKTAQSSPANSVRLLWVTSSGYMLSKTGGLDFENPSTGSAWQLYGQSKAVNLQQAIIYGEKLKKHGIVVVSAHPGNLETELQRHAGNFAQRLMKSALYEPIYGAYTELYCVLNPDITTEDNGKYAIPWGKFGRINELTGERARGEEGKRLTSWLDDQVKNYV